jgi:TRAP-type mannitol/chloroaromatic compound transport system substrate-binding protein
MQAKYDARNPAALKRLVASGAKLHAFDATIMKAAYDAAMALYDDLSTKNPAWKKVYSDYAAFRDEQNLWFSFTEANFDSFMQRGRFAKAKAPAKK